MLTKKVNYVIEVPNGAYCWMFHTEEKRKNKALTPMCKYFNRYGDQWGCRLSFPNINSDITGVLKPNECHSLKQALRT